MPNAKLGIDTSGKTVTVEDSDRREGTYILGSSGTGKSTLLKSLIQQDIINNRGVCVLDPHGDLIQQTIALMPPARYQDVILLDLTNPEYVFGLNLFHCEKPTDLFAVENVISQVMHVLDKVYNISTLTPQMNQYFLNITQTLLYNAPLSILDITRLFSNKAFRLQLAANVPNKQVQWFWEDFFENRAKFHRDAEISAVSNKLDDFFRPVLKPIFGQEKSTINMRKIMDERKILLVRMNARWESVTKLIGSVLVGQILDAAYSRADIPTLSRKHFSLYADEFQWFASSDFSTLFSEARKYGVAVTIAHQTLQQVDLNIVATCKQARNIIIYRVSGANAKEIASEFDCSPIPGLPQEKSLPTPVLEPINHMATKGVHVYEATRKFAERYAKLLVDEARQEEQREEEARRERVQLAHSPSRFGINSPIVEVTYDKRERLKLLNKLFYDAMIAGKEGKSLDTIPVDDVVADIFLQRFAEGRITEYFTLREKYKIETNRETIEPTTRIEEITDAFAHNRLLIEGKNASLRREEDDVRKQVKELYKKRMRAELVELHKYTIIVEKPQSLLELLGLVDNNILFLVPESQYTSTSFFFRKKDKDVLVINTTKYMHSYYREKFFSTWEEAVRYYLNLYKKRWLQIDENIFLDQNNWIETERKVLWNKDSSWSKNREIKKNLYLFTWELQPDIEQLWITPSFFQQALEHYLAIREEQEESCEKGTGKKSWEDYAEYEKMYGYRGHRRIYGTSNLWVEVDDYLQEEIGNSEFKWLEYIHKRARDIGRIKDRWDLTSEPLQKELDLLYAMQTYKIDYDNSMADVKEMLREIMRELALEPIQADSGLMQPIPTEISSSEVESRIANDLTLLPRFTAKVRLASGEHIITTVEPKVKLSDTALQEQIKKIQENNLKEGYLRLRSEVEKEIQDRQQPSEPPTPQPQPAQPKPKTPPTSGSATVQPPAAIPTPRTRILGTPMTKQCSACGTQNAVTAKFCNGCGATLQEK